MKVIFFLVLALATIAFCADEEFIDTCLDAHNKERDELNIAPLRWSDDLAERALKWAKTLAKKNTLKHSSGREHIGENIARRKSRSNSLELLLESWSSEKKYYRHRAYPKCSRTGDKSDVGHYTQMIWEDTTEVGCGMAKGFGRDYLVCNYETSGNRNGKYAYDANKDEVEEDQPVEIVFQPIEPQPVETQPAEAQPVETQPIETQPIETQPIEAQPVETIPVETKPVEAEPVETKPVETKPVETKPVETKPVETKPVETKPVHSDPFIADCLEAHNVERRLVGTRDLTWSEELAQSALKWAKSLASKNTLKHSSGRNHIGENIAYTGTKKNSVPKLLEMWTSEKKYYRHRPYPECSTTGDKSDVGHYTQIIWKDTTQVGCGLATAHGRDFIVCQYKTSGNRIGKYAY
jgi:uncharacterized protein YkwD